MSVDTAVTFGWCDGKTSMDFVYFRARLALDEQKAIARLGTKVKLYSDRIILVIGVPSSMTWTMPLSRSFPFSRRRFRKTMAALCLGLTPPNLTRYRNLVLYSPFEAV